MSTVARIAVRDDGFCAADGCRNVRPEAAVRMGDPFCSRQCATDSFAALGEAHAERLGPDGGASPSANGFEVFKKQPRVGPSERVTLAHIANGRQTAPEIAWARGCNVTAVSMHLKTLLDKQLIVRVSRGVYQLAALPPDSGREPRGDELAVAPRAATPSSAAAPAEADPPPPSRPEEDDDFPNPVKDAYSRSLIAAVRAFADTLEDELALL